MIREQQRGANKSAAKAVDAAALSTEFKQRLEALAPGVPLQLLLEFAVRCGQRVQHLPGLFTVGDPSDPVVLLRAEIEAALRTGAEACSVDDAPALRELKGRAKRVMYSLESIGQDHYDEFPAPIIYAAIAADRVLQATIWLVENTLSARPAGAVPAACAFAAANAVAALTSLTDNSTRSGRLNDQIRAAIDRDLQTLSHVHAGECSADDRRQGASLFADLWPEAGGTTAAASPRGEASTLADLLNVCGSFRRRIELVAAPIVDDLQTSLGRFAGLSFGSFQANQQAAREIQMLLTRLGKRVRCPKEGCGAPAILRCRVGTRMKSGVFQFEHAAGGRKVNHLGSTTLPVIRLVPAPPDPRRNEIPEQFS